MIFPKPMGLAPAIAMIVLAGCSPAKGCDGACRKKPASHSKENRTMQTTQEKSYPALNLEGLARIVETREATVVDANGSESFAEGHIPGALDFEAMATSLPVGLPRDLNAAIVVYFGGPRCMAWKRAAIALSDLGYTRISHFPGGLQEWQAAGKPMEGSPEGTHPITFQESTGRMLGCSLSAKAQVTRIDQLRSGLFREILSVEETEGKLKLKFADSSETVQKLTSFIKFERECCSSLQFGLVWEAHGGPVVLELEGPGPLLQAFKQASSPAP